MGNLDVLAAIKRSRFKRYEIAEALGVNEATFSRWFRRELTDEQKLRIKVAIEKLTVEYEMR